MGGKQSTESNGGTQTINDRGHSSRSDQNHPTRRSTVTMGALSQANHRSMLRYNSSGPSQADPRSSRTNSAVESGLRIPRTGFEWLYANLQDSDSSPEENAGSSRAFARALDRRNFSRSLPPYFFSTARDSKCSMCGKLIPAEDVEFHFVMCSTKPRVTYNEEVLSSSSAGECAICLEDLEEGEPVARLPCLCIYHKICIDQWFVKSQTCPEHPPD